MSENTLQKTLKLFDERIIQAMNRYVLSGMAVGVVQDGRLVYGKGFGLADSRNNRQVTMDTVFRIASISKTFTAIGVMQLWEQGKFQLDDPVNEYLKGYKVLHPDPQAPPVTFRHMLTHTSGIGEAPNLKVLFMEEVLGKGDRIMAGEPVPTLAEVYQGRLTPDVYPGEKWAYANHAYATLGQLIEDISGEPFPQYMLRHVFEPLGMGKTDFEYSDRVKNELAQGYTLKKGCLVPVEVQMFPGMAAGTVFTSVNEMARYLAALMNGGSNEHGSVIKPETLKMMMTAHYQQDTHLEAMGLGFFLKSLEGHPAAWHGGDLWGFNSAMWVAPEDKLGLVVFANSNTRAIYSLAEGFLRSLLGLPDLDSRLPVPGVLNPTHLWPQLCGFYGPRPGMNSNTRIWLNFGGEVEISIGHGKGAKTIPTLMLRSLAGLYTRGIALHPSDPNDSLVYENVTDGKQLTLVFQRNSEGYVDRFNLSALSFATFYRKPKVQSLRFKINVAASALLGATLAFLGTKLKKRTRKEKR